jgi:hypothetical protein
LENRYRAVEGGVSAEKRISALLSLRQRDSWWRSCLLLPRSLDRIYETHSIFDAWGNYIRQYYGADADSHTQRYGVDAEGHVSLHAGRKSYFLVLHDQR